jgi:hypothetical protein
VVRAAIEASPELLAPDRAALISENNAGGRSRPLVGLL